MQIIWKRQATNFVKKALPLNSGFNDHFLCLSIIVPNLVGSQKLISRKAKASLQGKANPKVCNEKRKSKAEPNNHKDLKKKHHYKKNKKTKGRLVDEHDKPHRSFQHSSQWRDIGRAQRHAMAAERRKQHTEKRVKQQIRYMRHIQGGVPKIVALVPLSKSARCDKIKAQMLRYCGVDTTPKQKTNPTFLTTELRIRLNERKKSKTNFIGTRKANFLLWNCPRHVWSVVDITKVADIVLLVSCPSKDFFEQENGKPHKRNMETDDSHLETYQSKLLGLDEESKLFCNIIRSQGISSIMGLFQPRYQRLDGQIEPQPTSKSRIQCKVTNNVVTNFNRMAYFEFGTTIEKQGHWRVLHAYDMPQLFRFLDTCSYSDTEWREKRNYLLGENVEFVAHPNDAKHGTLKVTGFLRGKRPLDINLPIHITGVGDFLMEKIEEVPVTAPKKLPLLPSERKILKKQERSRANKSAPNSLPTTPLNKSVSDNAMQDVDMFDFLDNNQDKEIDNVLEDLIPSAENKQSDDINETKDINMTEKNIKKETNDQVASNFVLAEGNRDTQVSLQTLRTLDELATAMDQSLITEEELREADNRRREIAILIYCCFGVGLFFCKKKKKKKASKDKKGNTTDHREAWEDVLGWSYGQESSEEEDRMSNNSVRDIIAETQALKISEEEKNNPIEVMARQKVISFFCLFALERKELQYKDEVDTPLHLKAKDKFAQYRGLKQFSRVKWDKFELLPVEYSRIHNINDWKMAKKQSNINNKQIDKGLFEYGVQTGRKISIYIKNVPFAARDLWLHSSTCPTLVWGLLAHEHKISVCHYLVKKCASYQLPVQGLETYLFDCGYRRWKARPIFSENSKFDKHLVTKFLSDTDHTVVSFYGPIAYPPLPVLMFEDPKSPIVKERRKTKTLKDDVSVVTENARDDVPTSDDEDEEDDDDDEATRLRKTVEKKWEDELDMYDTNNARVQGMIAEDIKELKHLRRKAYIRIATGCSLCAIGNLLEINAHRLLIKRKILTGFVQDKILYFFFGIDK
ncbi:20S rRNA accumulation protein [Reticulomyxa filosa]|uniref:20S rRNA accumulation protein n=1 Tax=Reticulomyxa filosa TaxID=46433 RepID=X6MN95_RETFI|nr:20S rRNA accumulation protein [Reticulomyxa filosa]|eukprot:ETO14867.1 20S rRNA accumulation protein [Reticulomyxa filosa]